MDKNKKIIIGVIILLFIIVIGIVVAYKLIENSVTNRENYKVNIENISSTPVDTVNLEESLIYEETVSPNENYVSYDEEKGGRGVDRQVPSAGKRLYFREQICNAHIPPY